MLADLFQSVLHMAIVVQLTANLSNLFWMQTDLPRAPSRIGHRKHRDRMPFASFALGASLTVANGALQKRTAENVTQIGKPTKKGSSVLFVFHSYK